MTTEAKSDTLPKCRRCGRPMLPQRQQDQRTTGITRYGGRQLCTGCYSWARINNRLAEFSTGRLRRRAADVAEDHADLNRQGLNDHEIAARLGLKLDSLQAALRRARSYQAAARKAAA